MNQEAPTEEKKAPTQDASLFSGEEVTAEKEQMWQISAANLYDTTSFT